MPRPAPEIRVAVVTADVVLVAADETEIVQLDGISTVDPEEDVLLLAFFVCTTAAATTALTPRIRRGATTAGTLVGEANAVTKAASTTVDGAAYGRDNPGNVASQSYILSLQATGPVANGSVLSAILIAIVGAHG